MLFLATLCICSKLCNFTLFSSAICTAYCKLKKLQYISAILPLKICKIHNNILQSCEIHNNILQSITPLCVMTILIFFLCNTTKKHNTFVFYFVLLQIIYKGYSFVDKVAKYITIFCKVAKYITIFCKVLHHFAWWQY